MGKNLKGKECGKGICQRKGGRYCARYVDKCGKRHEKYFSNIPEARNWLDDMNYLGRHSDVFVPKLITVDEWFSFWVEHIICDLSPNTIRNYTERYHKNIRPVIGNLQLSEVKPLYCKIVLN